MSDLQSRLRALQEKQGISYANRGREWTTLVTFNGWTGRVIERLRCGEGDNQVIYVSPAHDETAWANFFWRSQLSEVATDASPTQDH